MYKAILVDDEILVREAIGENIDWKNLGYELVADCGNGQIAIDYIKQNPVDLVLTDINMPYVDGLALSKYIHENYPETIVVIFSGHSEFEYAKKAIQYNVAEYLLKPVTPKELMETLNNVKEKLNRKQKEEKKLQRLEDAYTSYTKNEAVLIANELSALVKGTQDPEISLANLKGHGMELKGAFFRAGVIDIDVYLEGTNTELYEKKESALMSFVVENISDEILRRENCGLAYRDKDGRVCVLLYTNKPREFERRTHILFEEIRKNVFSSMGLRISIGVGKYVNRIENLFESYESALTMLNYQYVKGTDIYFDYESNKNKLEASVDLGKYLKGISKALKTESSEIYKNELDTLYKEIKGLYIEKNQVTSYLQQIILSVHDSLLEVYEESVESIQNRDLVITEVIHSSSLKEGMKIVNAYCSNVYFAIDSVTQSSGSKQANMAIAYLQEHYYEKDLGLSSICSYLGISTSHFSNIFKEATGETFMESLTRIRMEKAKQLLLETSLKNYEIAERVGFSDPHYFNIAFKKMTGMTPKAFAKENR